MNSRILRTYSVLSFILGMVIAIAVLLQLYGCATTPKGKVIETQNIFKAMVKTYNREMDLQQNEAVKQEWRDLFPPLFEKMDKVLRAYESAVLQDFDIDQKMELVLFIKNQILLEFLRANIEFKNLEKEVK